MTVRELIEELKDYDPDAIVCTGGNEPLSFTEILPAYYDGRLRKVIKDEHETPIKIETNAYEAKVKLHSYDIEEVVFDNPRIEIEGVDYDKRYLETYARWRQEGLDCERELRGRYNNDYDYLKMYDGKLFVWDIEEEV